MWNKICDDATIIEEGVVSCLTLPIAFPPSRVRVQTNERNWSRVNNGLEKFSQVDEWTAIVTKATISGTPANKITYEGYFPASSLIEGFKASASFRGYVATTSAFNATRVELMFPQGLPTVIE